MLQNEIKQKLGITRKALQYYEEKGLISIDKYENGYRDYSNEDVEVLKKIVRFRKLGLSIKEIESVLTDGDAALATILRNHQIHLDLLQEQQTLLEYIVREGKEEEIDEMLSNLKYKETFYDSLMALFPGYLGQSLFASYKVFMQDPISEEKKQYFIELIDFLDALPPFPLTREEEEKLELLSKEIRMDDLYQVSKQRVDIMKDFEAWRHENEKNLQEFQSYLESEEYRSSILFQIKEKMKQYFLENHYYETVIPLLCQCSDTYKEYYDNLIKIQ